MTGKVKKARPGVNSAEGQGLGVQSRVKVKFGLEFVIFASIFEFCA